MRTKHNLYWYQFQYLSASDPNQSALLSQHATRHDIFTFSI